MVFEVYFVLKWDTEWKTKTGFGFVKLGKVVHSHRAVMDVKHGCAISIYVNLALRNCHKKWVKLNLQVVHVDFLKLCKGLKGHLNFGLGDIRKQIDNSVQEKEGC